METNGNFPSYGDLIPIALHIGLLLVDSDSVQVLIL
jgi:hypothetical protein